MAHNRNTLSFKPIFFQPTDAWMDSYKYMYSTQMKKTHHKNSHMFPLFAILTKVINSAPRLWLGRTHTFLVTNYIKRFLLFTFPIQFTDKIHLQALNVWFSFQSRKHLHTNLLWESTKRVHTMEKRQFSIRDKQISVLSWKLGVWLVCLPKKMDPHAELQMNQI